MSSDLGLSPRSITGLHLLGRPPCHLLAGGDLSLLDPFTSHNTRSLPRIAQESRLLPKGQSVDRNTRKRESQCALKHSGSLALPGPVLACDLVRSAVSVIISYKGGWTEA